MSDQYTPDDDEEEELDLSSEEPVDDVEIISLQLQPTRRERPQPPAKPAPEEPEDEQCV